MLPAVEIGTWYWTNLKFFGLVVVGRIIRQRVFPVCGIHAGNVRCSTKPSRSRFKEMVRFLLFDVKSEGSEKLFHDKLSLISTLWNTLRTLSKHMHMVHTQQSMNSCFHVQLDAGLCYVCWKNLKIWIQFLDGCQCWDEVPLQWLSLFGKRREQGSSCKTTNSHTDETWSPCNCFSKLTALLLVIGIGHKDGGQ